MTSSTSSTRYLRRVLHKDDILLDNNNIFNENNNDEGLDISTYNAPADGESPKIQSNNEKQNYNKSMWDLGISPSILFAEAAVVTLIVGTYCNVLYRYYCCGYC